MSNRTIRILILALLLTALAASLAQSASFTYASHRKEIKAGVLIFPDGSGVYSVKPPAPYLFYVLNQRTDVKPQGWEFTNPLSASRVTRDIMNRWSGVPGPVYNEGDPITKEMGCYWEVKIDASLAELSQFDVLFLGVPTNISLGRTYREKLRKLVDSGGVLWIENCFNGDCTLTGFFASDVLFDSSGSVGWAAAPNPVHPLVHRPYDLAWDEISRLGTDSNELTGRGMHRVGGSRLGFSAGGDKYFTTVIGVGGAAGTPIVAGAQYGSGHIVASAESIGYAVSAFGSTYYTTVGSSTVKIQNGTYCPAERASLAPTEDVKAAVNFCSWGGEHGTFHKNARHTGYSFDEVGAPLALKWNYDPGVRLATGSSPAILNDMVFYVDGRGILHAFDLSPSQDLDRNNNIDDGIVDYATGLPYDEVWFAQCDEPASSPTVALVPVGGGAAVPAVFLATLSGKILAFNANTGGPLTGGSAQIMQTDEPYQLAAGDVTIPAPTYFEGTVYVGDNTGALYAVNLLSGGAPWRWPLVKQPLPPIKSSPTVGYFRNPITGSVDQLVYLAAAGFPNSRNGCVYSFPIKVYNEVLTAVPGIPSQFRVRKYQTMAIRNDPDTYQLYFSVNDGEPQPIPDTDVAVIQPGTFNISVPVPSGASVIADYEIDTANTNYPPQYRQRIDVKNRIQNNPEGYGVACTPAAAPNDTIYYATENGSFYAVIEDGWGITTKWRWYLEDQGVSSLGLSGGKPVGSPAVGNGKVYFAVNAGSNACILAFDADPVFRISVGGPIDPRRPVEVLQYDSMNPGREPVAVSGAAEGTDTSRRRVAFKVDYDKGRITLENFLDPLSASQNLIVRYYPPSDTPGPGARVEQIHAAFPGTGDIVYDDYWNNLAWCLKIPDAEITSSPMLLGSMLYFGSSAGRLHAVNVQRISQTSSKGAVLTANPGIHSLWPDLGQPALGSDTDPNGMPIQSTVGGGQGHIAVSSPEGLAVLYNALTLVTDNKRVLEMDSSGKVVWSCDSTSTYTGTRLSQTDVPVYAADKKSFNKPAVARRIGTSNVLVADTGNNRVVLIDRAGNALCEVAEFRDPGRVLPPGAPLRLNAPTDAWVWTAAGPGGTMVYRFLIADPGNFRVVELEAQFDPATGRYSTVNLLWATHTLEQGKRYRYISARRYDVSEQPRFDRAPDTKTICVIDNLSSEQAGLDTTGGAIVTINDATGLIAPVNGIRRYVDRVDGSVGTAKIVNPTFFSREFRAGGLYTDVIGDANGVYAAYYTVGSDTASSVRHYAASNHRWIPDPATPNIFRKRPLSVASAQLLPSGNILVTNKAPSLDGNIPGFAAQGEVFEIMYDDVPPVDPAYPWIVVWPTGSAEPGQGSYSLEQPSSAQRLYQ